MRWVVSGMMFWLTGCLSTVPLTTRGAAALQGHSLTVTRHESRDVEALTALRTSLKPTREMISVLEYGIGDTARGIGDGIGRGLAEKFGATVVREDPLETPIPDSDDPATLASPYPSSDFVLDVRTTVRGLVYLPLDWFHYRVGYSAQLRLIDGKSKQIIAQGSCSVQQDAPANRFTYDRFLADKAAVLKEQLRLAGAACAESLWEEIFEPAEPAHDGAARVASELPAAPPPPSPRRPSFT